jgi:RHS repeat-associated protein
MTRAGGVGGLLMANLSGTNCFAGYDGNGNLTAFINAADKSLAARYEYSPYGQLIRETGLLAAQIPFRYSTKFWDEESGLVYYGHRYYSPCLGKWISRDRASENGGINLLRFVCNSPLNNFDTDGNISWKTLALTVATWLNSIYGPEAENVPPNTFLTEEGGPMCEMAEEEARRLEGGEVAETLKGRTGQGPTPVVGTVILLVVVETDTAVLAGAAIWETEMGLMSADPLFANLGGYFQSKIKGGDSAYGDLDEVMAALQIGGFQDEAVLGSLGVLDTIGNELQ